MTIYSSPEELTEVMTSLWERIKSDPEMASKLKESKLIVQFKYRDPDAVLTVDCSDGEDLKVVPGDTVLKPIVEMSMKADVAHEFWMGRVNVPLAIMMGKIVSRGPTPRALALLPVIKPAFKMYPDVLKEYGKEALLVR